MQRVEVNARLHPALLLIGMEGNGSLPGNQHNGVDWIRRSYYSASARAGSIANIPDIALPVVLSRANLLGGRAALPSGKATHRSWVSSDSGVKLGSACLVLSRVPVRAGLGHRAAIRSLGL